MRRIRGLTLIELLIAISIFSIFVLSIYSAFQTGILSYRKVDSAFSVYQTARIVLNRIESDLKNSFAYAQADSRFKGDKASMNFFSLVNSFSEDKFFLDLCRIKYELADGILKRICYKGQDAVEEDTDIEGKELSYEVKDISFQYAYATNNPDKPYDWQELWPKDSNQNSALPLTVKIKLSLVEKDERQREQEKIIEFNKIVSLPLAEKIAPSQ